MAHAWARGADPDGPCLELGLDPAVADGPQEELGLDPAVADVPKAHAWGKRSWA